MKTEVFIDISRLLRRALRGRLPTGVDRVCLAYVARWGEHAQAVLLMGRVRRVLARAIFPNVAEFLRRSTATSNTLPFITLISLA